MKDELLAHLHELRVDNVGTGELLHALQARDEKEKADIAATIRVFTSWWEKHHAGEQLPAEVVGALPQSNPVPATTNGADLAERVKQSLATAYEQLPPRFTTKDFFPLVPEIQSQEVPDSQGYDFLRRKIDEGTLWTFQQGAGRRPTIFSKQFVGHLMRSINTAAAKVGDEIAAQMAEGGPS